MFDYKVTKKFDYDVTNNQFTFQQYIESLINITLFTKGRANAEQVPSKIHRGGYVGNILYGKNNKIGSLLWLYTRQQNNTPANASEVQKLIYNDLKFLISKNIVKTLSVSVATNQNSLSIVIKIDSLQPIQYSI